MWSHLPRRYPLLIPVFSLILGLLAGVRFEDRSLLLPISFLAIAGLAFLLPRLRAGPWALALFGFGLGWVRVCLALSGTPAGVEHLDAPGRVEASWRVEGYAECAKGLCRFPARLLGLWIGEEFQGLDLGIALKGRGEVFVIPGEIYRSTLKLRSPRGFRNPESFDYPRYLYLSGISANAFVDRFEEIRRERGAVWPYRVAGALRQRLRDRIRAAVPEGPARGVLAALLLGDAGMLDGEVEEDFRRAGLTHVLVVSGLHFSLVLFFFYLPGYFLFSRRHGWAEAGLARRLALGLALLPTFGYGLLVGLSPSVLRGLGFCALIFLTVALRRRRDFSASLLLVAGLLLCWQPLWLFSLSFQLSFLSVAAVYYFGKSFLAWWESLASSRPWLRHGLPRWTATTLYVSLLANLALLPLLARAFHEVSLIAPLANLIFVPFFASFLLPAELLGLVADLIHPSWAEIWFKALAKILDFALSWLAALARWRHAGAWVGTWQFWEWPAYLGLLAAFLNFGRWRKFLILSVAALVLFLGGTLYRRLLLRPPLLTLSMLDVGQGESLILRLPEGQALVIDGGGFPYSDFDVGGKVVLPELLGRDIRRPAALVLTHVDADHWKGLHSLAERWELGEFWIGPGTLEAEDFAGLKAVLARRQIPIRLLSQGQAWTMGGAEFEVLWPPADVASRSGLSDNEVSLVLRVCYLEVCLLLTGDIEAQAEAGLVPELAKRRSQILKVAHHGSGTSSGEAFLNLVRPSWALISAGAGNRYRLPHPQVVRRLAATAQILRTDRMGQVEVETDGREIWVRRFIDGPFPSRWSAIRAAVFGSWS